MKITKRQLRKLLEGIFVGDDDGTVLSPKDVDDLEYSGVQKDDMSRGHHPKLDALRSTNPKQARSLAVSLGLQDDLTPYEELAVDDIDDQLIDSPRTPVEHSSKIVQNILLMREPSLKRIAEKITKDFNQYIRSPVGMQRAKDWIEQLLYYQESGITPGPIKWYEVDWRSGIIMTTRGFSLTKRIYQELGPRHDQKPKAMALLNYLNSKLQKIALQRFNKEFAELLIDEMEGKEKFPLTLTEAELKQIIMKELAERKKRKKKKKKKTKSKKRGYLYPYVYGHHDHDFHDYGYDVSDSGFDGGGGDGGGE